MSMKHRVPLGRVYFLVMTRVNYVNETEGSARAGVNYVNETWVSARADVLSRHGLGKLCQWNKGFC